MTGQERADAPELATAEVLEISYQFLFFVIGTPLNLMALRKTRRKLREGGVESRLVTLSRQLMMAHVMVLFVYGVWRSYWLWSFWWTQGDIMCRVFSFLATMPFHLWSNIVAAIAVDMLCCIRSPLSSYRTGVTRVKYFISFSWALAIFCSIPMFFFRGVLTFHNSPDGGWYVVDSNNDSSLNFTGPVQYQCYALIFDYDASTLVAFNTFHILTTFYVPLAFILGCYVAIGLSLHRQMAERKQIVDGGSVTARSSATKVRFLRATIAIVCTFVFTWLPYQVLALLRVLCADNDYCKDMSKSVTFMQAIIIASTCINPFLYQFGSGRRTRASHHGSTYDSTHARAVIVACHQKHSTAEILSLLPKKTASMIDLKAV